MVSSISNPVDTYVGGGAWRGSCIRSIGVGAVGQQQVSVTPDVQERVCCMQCVVRSVDVQPAVAKASTMMSVMLETCVTRPLMDMTTEERARVMPATTTQENRNNPGRRGRTGADFFAACRISRAGNDEQAGNRRDRGVRRADLQVRRVWRVVGRGLEAAPDSARPRGRAAWRSCSGVRLEIEKMNDGAQRLRRRSVHERL
jgi:hypothetical protein